MKNTFKVVLAIFFVLFLASYKEDEKLASALSSPMEEIDTTNIKKSLMQEVRNFIDEHPKTNAFILYNMLMCKKKKGDGDNCIGCRTKFNEIFCITEAYDFHFGEGEFIIRENYPHKYFDINGKIVFVPSNDDAFYDQKKLKAIYEKTKFIEEDRQLDKHYFLLYDLKDSCGKAEFPFYGDSIYEYTSEDFIPVIVEKVRKSIKFEPPTLK